MRHSNLRLAPNYPSPARLLILGCGDVGLRLIRWLRQRHPPQRLQILASARRNAQAHAIREAGAMALTLDFDDPKTLHRLTALASWIVVLVPPSDRSASTDQRAQRIIAGLSRTGGLFLASGIRGIPMQPKALTPAKPAWPAAVPKLLYISTTGVFGDWNGAWIDETAKACATQARSLRRLHAELQFRQRCFAVRLRVPGIYAEDRLPLARIRDAKPCLQHDEDGYSNHIHADDLAYLLWLCLFRAPASRLYALVDNEPLKMGQWFDHIAKRHALPPVPRLSRLEVQSAVSPMMWSFMQESRRIRNLRMHREIQPRLKAPCATTFLDEALAISEPRNKPD